KKKKKQQRKAPGAPTRPRSAYLFFSMEQRCKIKQEMGNSVSVRSDIKHFVRTFAHALCSCVCCTWNQATEVMKRCAELWKNVPPAEMTRFNLLAEQDKLRYDE